jgi:hypothetical protein
MWLKYWSTLPYSVRLDWAWAAPARPRAMVAAMRGLVFFT